ncbi:MAG TPA: Uma2 family endonuclease [Thermoanaerobaculia bacterium]|nr:Uma2 family endonuclease [Thermoanaerobaculia bacterium]
MANDWITQWRARTPENKLELIDGQFIISTLEGSRRIAWMLLEDYGPALALPMAPPDLWWAALEQAFDPQPRPQTPEEWTAWAATVEHDPEPPPAGPYGTQEHRRVFDLLQRGFYSLPRSLGRSLGRDFVIHLGENALTPDLLFVDPSRLESLYEYYLDGPPTVVIEITLEGRGEQERGLKLRLYEGAGIPEYWLFESASQQALFFRLDADGRYEQAEADSEGVYRSTAVPGLALSLPHLWTMDATHWDPTGLPFLRPPAEDDGLDAPFEPSKEGLQWDSLPFAPRVGLQPAPIRFEEFVSWCPEAKFERVGGLWIGGSEGSRRSMGMLLMTLGLVEIVKLATPRDWVTFLHPEPYQDLVQTHTDALMARAEYESGRFFDEDYFYGKIPDNWGLTAVGDDADECRRNLTQKVRDWVLLKIARGEDPAGADG